MKPRGFWSLFFLWGGNTAWITFLSITLALIYKANYGVGLALSLGIFTGIAGGLIAGFMAASLLKKVKIKQSYQDKKASIAKIHIAATEVGYLPLSQGEDFFIFKPSAKIGLMSGNLTVQFEEGAYTITGPSGNMKKLQKRLKE